MTTPTGIGLTALTMAQERLVESRRPDRLFDDPLAEAFLAAVPAEGAGLVGSAEGAGLVSSADGAGLVGSADGAGLVSSADGVQVVGSADDPTLGDLVPEFRGFVPLRTRCFDDRFNAAAAQGYRQFVIVAAGFDTRSHRLPLDDCVVYELDAEDVTLFRESVLERLGTPRAQRVPRAVDLREDFAAQLAQAGFDPDVPTVWLLEGLLMYLSPEAADQLMSRLGNLSAPDSMLLADQFRPKVWKLAEHRSQQIGVLDEIGASWLSTIDDPLDWLAGHGWDAAEIDLNGLAAEVGRDVPAVADNSRGTPAVWLASGVRRVG